MRHMPVEWTPMRCMPMKCIPVRCTPVECTSVRCMSMKCIHEMHAHKMHARKVHTHETPAHPLLWWLSGPNSGRFMYRHLSFKNRVFTLVAGGPYCPPHPVGVLGRAYFLKFLQLLCCVTVKTTIYVIISGAPFSS